MFHSRPEAEEEGDQNSTTQKQDEAKQHHCKGAWRTTTLYPTLLCCTLLCCTVLCCTVLYFTVHIEEGEGSTTPEEKAAPPKKKDRRRKQPHPEAWWEKAAQPYRRMEGEGDGKAAAPTCCSETKRQKGHHSRKRVWQSIGDQLGSIWPVTFVFFSRIQKLTTWTSKLHIQNIFHPDRTRMDSSTQSSTAQEVTGASCTTKKKTSPYLTFLDSTFTVLHDTTRQLKQEERRKRQHKSGKQHLTKGCWDDTTNQSSTAQKGRREEKTAPPQRRKEPLAELFAPFSFDVAQQAQPARKAISATRTTSRGTREADLANNPTNLWGRACCGPTGLVCQFGHSEEDMRSVGVFDVFDRFNLFLLFFEFVFAEGAQRGMQHAWHTPRTASSVRTQAWKWTCAGNGAWPSEITRLRLVLPDTTHGFLSNFGPSPHWRRKTNNWLFASDFNDCERREIPENKQTINCDRLPRRSTAGHWMKYR